MPRWRHKARIGIQMPNGIGLSLQWRYIGKVKAETLDEAETLHSDNHFEPGLHIKAFNYFDLASTVAIGDHYNFRLGVNNLFDKRPPFATGGNANVDGTNLCPTGSCNGNIYPGAIYIGTVYQVGLEAIIPANKQSGSGVGVIGQLHFYLDDMFPSTIGVPLLGAASPPQQIKF